MNAFEIETTPDCVHLRLNLELTIEQAGALHSALASALTTGRVLVVDPTALTRLDTAALQVLLAAARSATGARLSADSSVWTAALQRHGLTDPFAQP